MLKKRARGPCPFGPPPRSVPALTLDHVIQPPKKKKKIYIYIYIQTHTHTHFYLSIYHFFFYNTKYFYTQTRGENVLKITDSSVYPKGYNSWIHSTNFKPLYLSIYLSIYTSINNKIFCLSFIILLTKISLHKI